MPGLRIHPRVRHDLVRVWLPAVATLGVLLCGICFLILRADAGAEAELEERFAVRTGLAAGYAQAFVADLKQRERREAAATLFNEKVSSADFERTARSLGFGPAVLLDGTGRVLAVYPPSAQMLGKPLLRYVHLRRAVAGQDAVSNVVPSAVMGDPIVALAVPFSTSRGWRVFSGGLRVTGSALGASLETTSPIRGAAVAITDSAGTIVAQGGEKMTTGEFSSAGQRARGNVTLRGERYWFVRESIGGTPWTLVAFVPRDALLSPLHGSESWTPWLIFAALAAAALGCLILLHRLMVKNRHLASLAESDPLTGLANRRSLEAAFVRETKQRLPFALAVVDLNDFKTINDSYGHAAGDDALREVATRLREAVRPMDLVARIGGDEFAVLLHGADEAGLSVVDEHLTRALTRTPIVTADGLLPALSATVGLAMHERGEPIGSTLARADAALYTDKRDGRDALATSDRAPDAARRRAA